MAREDFIRIDGVVKKFGSFVALHEAKLAIREREFFSLLGPSGCGKTTLLRMIAGFEQPTTGEIYLDGKPMSDVPPNIRPTNMVFQSYAVFPHLSVRQNLAYAYAVAGRWRDSVWRTSNDSAVTAP